MTSMSQYQELAAVQAMVPNVVNNDSDGKGITVDTNGAESCLLVINVGDSGDTLSGTLKHEFYLQHSDTDSDGAFVTLVDTDQDLVEGATLAATTGYFYTIDDPAEDQVVFAIAYVGPKRYVRVVDNTTGTHTNGTPMSMVAIKGHQRRTNNV